MIKSASFCDMLATYELTQFYGVPDSLLKHLCAYIQNVYSSEQHVICANEGNAIAMAMGHYLGTSRPAVVYMQNSGLGNAVNPLLSLADPAIYSVPMLLIVGWRGEPGVKDEPQHVKQGQITESMLQVMGIPFQIIDSDSDSEADIRTLLHEMSTKSRPVALLVRKGTFAAEVNTGANDASTEHKLPSREDVLEHIVNALPSDTTYIGTTGKTSRELYEIRTRKKQHHRDFLTVGGMGHASSIGLAVANARPDNLVVILDGDGAALMHMGAIPVIGCHSRGKLLHIILNNACHESVGGQPTVAGKIALTQVALASGYRHAKQVTTVQEMSNVLATMTSQEMPCLIEVAIRPGSRSDLGRPFSPPADNKNAFMSGLKANGAE